MILFYYLHFMCSPFPEGRQAIILCIMIIVFRSAPKGGCRAVARSHQIQILKTDFVDTVI